MYSITHRESQAQIALTPVKYFRTRIAFVVIAIKQNSSHFC